MELLPVEDLQDDSDDYKAQSPSDLLKILHCRSAKEIYLRVPAYHAQYLHHDLLLTALLLSKASNCLIDLKMKQVSDLLINTVNVKILGPKLTTWEMTMKSLEYILGGSQDGNIRSPIHIYCRLIKSID